MAVLIMGAFQVHYQLLAVMCLKFIHLSLSQILTLSFNSVKSCNFVQPQSGLHHKLFQLHFCIFVNPCQVFITSYFSYNFVYLFNPKVFITSYFSYIFVYLFNSRQVLTIISEVSVKPTLHLLSFGHHSFKFQLSLHYIH